MPGEEEEMKLFTDRAELYDKIYPKIFEYEEQFIRVDRVLQEYGCEKILEVASGCGHLAELLNKKDYDLTGSDISENMLSIAREKVPEVEFVKADMRDLDIDEKFDALVCMGNSFAIMTDNEEVDAALTSFNEHLKDGGILIFDNFNAEKSIKHFDDRYRKSEGRIRAGEKMVIRRHRSRWNLQTGITWDWRVQYIIKKDGEIEEKFMDKMTLRGFLRSELEYFLENNGFSVERFYMDDFLTLAKKR